MYGMFQRTGENVTGAFTIVGLETWNVSNVIDMSSMFSSTGMNATTFNISDISNWNTSNVTNMSDMFRDMGASSTNDWRLDLNSWNVSNVNNYMNFNTGVETKIIPPNFG